MACLFVALRLTVRKVDVSIYLAEARQLSEFGSFIFTVDDDVAIMGHDHGEDYVFTTVVMEGEVTNSDFSSLILDHYCIPQETSCSVFAHTLIE